MSGVKQKRPGHNHRWVTTKVVSQWDEGLQRYVELSSEGYWYDGPWALAHDVAAVWAAEDFRWRNDDGNITAATWIAAENTAVSAGVSPGHNVRLRVNFGETAKAAGAGVITGGWTLQFSKNGGAWTTLGAATDCQFFNSANLTNGTAIATANHILTWGDAGTAEAWGDENEDGVTPSFAWSDAYAETEFSVKFDAAGSAIDDVFTFRLLAPDGSVRTFVNVPTVTLAAEPPKTADGSPSITAVTASGQAEAIRTSDGSPSVSKFTSDGSASIPFDGATANGSPSISPITSAGVVEIIREAFGSPSISPITASGNSFIWPKVYLNTTQSLVGATEMTVTAVEADGTGATFDDAIGAPTGSVFLGVENRANGDVGWIAVTVTAGPDGPIVVFGGFGA